MTDINEMRCYASEIITKIMDSDNPAQERAVQLELLRAHANAAYEMVAAGIKKSPPKPIGSAEHNGEKQ